MSSEYERKSLRKFTKFTSARKIGKEQERKLE